MFSGESNTLPFFRRLKQIWKNERLKTSQKHGPRAYLIVVGWRHMCVFIQHARALSYYSCVTQQMRTLWLFAHLRLCNLPESHVFGGIQYPSLLQEAQTNLKKWKTENVTEALSKKSSATVWWFMIHDWYMIDTHTHAHCIALQYSCAKHTHTHTHTQTHTCLYRWFVWARSFVHTYRRMDKENHTYTYICVNMHTYICVSIQMLWNICVCINDYDRKNVMKKHKKTRRHA